MKKGLIFGIILLVLLSMLFACSKSPEKKLAGSWNVDLQFNEEKAFEDMDEDEIPVFKEVMKHTDKVAIGFKSDGKLTLSIKELEIGAWELKGDEEPYTLTVKVNNPNPYGGDPEVNVGIKFVKGKFQIVQFNEQEIDELEGIKEADVKFYFKKAK